MVVVDAATDKFAILALTAGLTQTVPIAPPHRSKRLLKAGLRIELDAKRMGTDILDDKCNRNIHMRVLEC
jgi:hypothetical protein